MSNLTFDEFSRLNAERCKTAFNRKIDPIMLQIHSLKACGEVGEFAQEVGRFIDSYPPGSKIPYPSAETIRLILFEAADAFTYLDLVASHLGFRFSEVLVEKFNIVSDRKNSGIKISNV